MTVSDDTKVTIVGTVIGVLLLSTYPLFYALTPGVPLVVALILSPFKALRPFSKGLVIAAAIGVLLYIVFMVVVSVAFPGTTFYDKKS